MDSEKADENFNAEEFVDFLLREGSKIACDDTTWTNQIKLPQYHDATLYRRGQHFFKRNVFPLLFGKILGLLSVLSIPTIVDILIFTKMSSTDFTAYKRYLSTLLHMTIWYEDDFSENSKLWQSIKEVKNRHNSASRKSCKISNLNHPITQKDMALTQFGFMGYALVRSQQIGLYQINEKDWKAFIHLWRVVGYLMGIQDRFNICRDSIDETRQICNLLIDKIFRPNIEKKDENFMEMSKYLMHGIWTIVPLTNYKAFLLILSEIVQPINNTSHTNNNNYDNRKLKKAPFLKLNLKEYFFYYLTIIVIWSLQFTIFRIYFNYVEHVAMWLRKNFPFIAYFKYGYPNAKVVVLPKVKNGS